MDRRFLRGRHIQLITRFIVDVGAVDFERTKEGHERAILREETRRMPLNLIRLGEERKYLRLEGVAIGHLGLLAVFALLLLDLVFVQL